MHYTIIDMEKDPRCGQFAYFRGMTFPFAGLTVEMDITDMMAARGSRPFFLSLLLRWCGRPMPCPSCGGASCRMDGWWSTTGARRPTPP